MLPSDIKKAAIALIISCISALIAVYFDGLVSEEMSYSDPFIFGINAVWVLIISWIIWDLFKGKEIKLTLVLVGLIFLASLIWDYVQFGFAIAQVFYAIELLMFITAFYLIRTDESKEWYATNNL